jgi:tetratricopeptide (TPR) repeat protein
MLLERKSYDKALESARRALARDPALAAARLLAGQALAGLGRCDEARRELDEALRLDPGNSAAAEARRACGG